MTKCRMCSQRLTRPGKLCRECERELQRARAAAASVDTLSSAIPVIDAGRERGTGSASASQRDCNRDRPCWSSHSRWGSQPPARCTSCAVPTPPRHRNP